MKILKVLVLLLSIAGGSLVVWNATRDRGAANRNQIEPKEMIGSSKSKATGLDFIEFESDAMQFSTKSGEIMDSEDIAKMVEYKYPEIKVTEEEVKRTRDMMMQTSKSGRIMSDDEIREMLERQNKEKLHLMHSSKVMIDPIIRREDMEKIIEGEKQDPSDLEKLPPKELPPQQK